MSAFPDNKKVFLCMKDHLTDSNKSETKIKLRRKQQIFLQIKSPFYWKLKIKKEKRNKEGKIIHK